MLFFFQKPVSGHFYPIFFRFAIRKRLLASPSCGFEYHRHPVKDLITAACQRMDYCLITSICPVSPSEKLCKGFFLFSHEVILFFSRPLTEALRGLTGVWFYKALAGGITVHLAASSVWQNKYTAGALFRSILEGVALWYVGSRKFRIVKPLSRTSQKIWIFRAKCIDISPSSVYNIIGR